MKIFCLMVLTFGPSLNNDRDIFSILTFFEGRLNRFCVLIC